MKVGEKNLNCCMKCYLLHSIYCTIKPSNMQKILKKFSNHKDIYGFLSLKQRNASCELINRQYTSSDQICCITSIFVCFCINMFTNSNWQQQQQQNSMLHFKENLNEMHFENLSKHLCRVPLLIDLFYIRQLNTYMHNWKQNCMSVVISVGSC